MTLEIGDGSGVVTGGTGIGIGVTAVDGVATGVEGPVGVAAGAFRPALLLPRYHPAPPIIVKLPIATVTRIDLRQDGGRIGDFGIGDLSGSATTFALGRVGVFSTDLTVFARSSKWRSSGGENASIHCEVEIKYSSDLAGGCH